MKGDFTRDTFDARNQFSRVLMQQGRVTLDADNNEQTAILLHYLRTLARDLIGPHGAPALGGEGGFALEWDSQAAALKIGAGRYYVDGWLVENHEQNCLYTAQKDYPLPDDDALLLEMQKNTGQWFWVYLDVWERHITAMEQDSIREAALNGVDTCSRAKVVWQVKALPVKSERVAAADSAKLLKELKAQQAALNKQLSAETDPKTIQDLNASLEKIAAQIAVLATATGAITAGGAGPGVSCGTPLKALPPFGQAWLAAGLADLAGKEDPCITSPESKYRGVENQLYRVEIHRGGPVGVATFKWSRDNGSIATRWLGSQGSDLLVANTRGFAAGNWVELSDDAKELQGADAQGKPRSVLVKLVKVENGLLTVDPATASDSSALAWSASLPNPTVRRWDQVERGDVVLDGGAVPVKEAAGGQPAWIDLEDGVRVQFSPNGQYRSGDYWLIPARVATGRLEWPCDVDASGKEKPKALPPRGIVHHYAPLGFVSWEGGVFQYQTCRCEFTPMSVCPTL